MLVDSDESVASVDLLLGVLDEEPRAVRRTVTALLFEFDDRFVRHELRRPDLTVRMRVGRARHRPSCLEDLHPRVALREFRLL